MNDALKLAQFDDLVEEMNQMREAGHAMTGIVCDLHAALWRANEALDQAKAALQPYVGLLDHEYTLRLEVEKRAKEYRESLAAAGKSALDDATRYFDEVCGVTKLRKSRKRAAKAGAS